VVYKTSHKQEACTSCTMVDVHRKH